MARLTTGFAAATFICAFFNVLEAEYCPPENCIAPNKCEETVKSRSCPEDGGICCSAVKSEFRTHCSHHGGVCMGSCGETLSMNTIDCVLGTTCCVLV